MNEYGLIYIVDEVSVDIHFSFCVINIITRLKIMFLPFHSTSFIYLSQKNFPEHVKDMSGLRWLRLSNTQLKEMPVEVGALKKLVCIIL